MLESALGDDCRQKTIKDENARRTTAAARGGDHGGAGKGPARVCAAGRDQRECLGVKQNNEIKNTAHKKRGKALYMMLLFFRALLRLVSRSQSTCAYLRHHPPSHLSSYRPLVINQSSSGPRRSYADSRSACCCCGPCCDCDCCCSCCCSASGGCRGGEGRLSISTSQTMTMTRLPHTKYPNLLHMTQNLWSSANARPKVRASASRRPCRHCRIEQRV